MQDTVGVVMAVVMVFLSEHEGAEKVGKAIPLQNGAQPP